MLEEALAKTTHSKIVRSLIEVIILNFLNAQPMHGYQLIITIRRVFGVYFGPSTVYPILNSLAKKEYVKSTWVMQGKRPRKVYILTSKGQTLLAYAESSLELTFRKMGLDSLKAKIASVELMAQ